MRRPFVWLLCGVLVAAVVWIYRASSSAPRDATAPAPTAPESTTPGTARAPFASPAEPSQLAGAVEQHLRLMQGQGADAQAALDASLATLRERPDVVAAAAELYAASGANRYLRRWSLVDLVGTLGDPEATEMLTRVARTPLPDAKAPEFGEEAMIRMRAVDGLTSLAMGGDAGARAALLACIQACPPLLKPSIVHAALLAGGGPSAHDEIAGALGPDEQWMLDLRVGDIDSDGVAIAPPADGEHDQPADEIPGPTP